MERDRGGERSPSNIALCLLRALRTGRLVEDFNALDAVKRSELGTALRTFVRVEIDAQGSGDWASLPDPSSPDFERKLKEISPEMWFLWKTSREV